MQDVLKDVSEGVMTLTLNRVDKKNALTQAMYGFIADAMLEAAAASSVHVLVLQGDPAIFSAVTTLLIFWAVRPRWMRPTLMCHGFCVALRPSPSPWSPRSADRRWA